MGFTTTIALQYGSGAGVNTLDGRGGLPALSTISAYSGSTYPQIRLSTANTETTAFVTAISFAQTVYNGGQTFVANQNGVFSFESGAYGLPITLPYKLWNSTTEGVNTLSFRLSATGQECASGVQVGTVYLTLSSTALSGTSAGPLLMPVTNVMPGINTSVFCVPTPFPATDPIDICQGEYLRKFVYFG